MMDKVEAPFTSEQIESLNGYQRSGTGHPFTCANREHPGDDLLVAHDNGLWCPTCGYVQTWAWSFMADGTWSKALEELKKFGFA